MSKIAISVQGVSKSFKLPHERYTGLKQALINFRPGHTKYEKQTVLKGVSFEIEKGEFFGIVGRNGSGKSTLLKLLAQIYTPDEGSVNIVGSLTPFIELGVGFNPELTGRENVFLNGALLGFDRKQMGEMYGDIVNFADIERFMDQKLKNYSSGMQVRLAFSIAIRAKSDILLIDEVLAVGDAAFQQKCFDYFARLKEEGRTIVFVSHDMAAIKQFCNRAVLVDKGEIVDMGDPVDVALEYERLLYAHDAHEDVPETETTQPVKLQVSAYNKQGKKAKNFEYGDPITLEVKWPKEYPVEIVGFAVSKGTEQIFATNSIGQKANLNNRTARLTIVPSFGNGRYRYTAGVFGKTRHDIIEFATDNEFLIYNQPPRGKNQEEWEGIAYAENKWE